METKSRSHSNPMSPHKAEERKRIEVEEEVAKEKDNREISLRGRTISIEANQTEVAGNPEVEEEEVVLIEVQTRENLGLLVKPPTKTDASIAMSQDISPENAHRGIMAMQIPDHNNRKPFQVLMWSNLRCMHKCLSLKWLKFQCRWQCLQHRYRCRTTA